MYSMIDGKSFSFLETEQAKDEWRTVRRHKESFLEHTLVKLFKKIHQYDLNLRANMQKLLSATVRSRDKNFHAKISLGRLIVHFAQKPKWPRKSMVPKITKKF